MESRLALTAVPLALIACSAPPVDWSGEATVVAAAGTAVVIGMDGRPAPDSMAALASRITPPGTPACPGSLRLSRARRALFAVWWAARPDSTAALLASRSGDDGATWAAAVPVDTTDRGASGCDRPPAAIAADSVSSYVHVTYAMLAPEGPGLFFAHSMDGGKSFHSPVPIIYGERLGRTSVSADGDVVVVGFEDPNSRTPRIGLAISRTMGHIFEQRVLPVSDENGEASHPLTAVRGRRIVVGWERRAASASPAALTVRAGMLR